MSISMFLEGVQFTCTVHTYTHYSAVEITSMSTADTLGLFLWDLAPNVSSKLSISNICTRWFCRQSHTVWQKHGQWIGSGLVEQGSPPTQYRLSGRHFTGQKIQPTVSKYWRKKCYKSKKNPEKANNTKYSNTIKRDTYKNITSPLVYSSIMGWLGDGSHRGQGRQAWTVVRLPPRSSLPSELIIDRKPAAGRLQC